MKWIRLTNNNAHLGSGEIEFAQIVLSLKMLNNEISDFKTSTDYEFGCNIISDICIDEIDGNLNNVDHVSPSFSLIYHKGDIAELDEFSSKCTMVFGRNNYKILKRITNNISPSLWSHSPNVIDIGAFFLKPTPHYYTESFSLSDYPSVIDDYNLMMTSVHDISRIRIFIDTLGTNHVCCCENASSIIKDVKFDLKMDKLFFHQIIDYGSVNWFNIFKGSKSFCEPRQMITCSALEALYLKKTVYFAERFNINDPNFKWSPHDKIWQLSVKTPDIFEKLDLRYKLIEVLKLL